MSVQIIKYDWQADSLCKTELKFIPETGDHVHYTADDFYPPIGKLVSDEVKNMCNRCPVQNDCLEHALAYEKYGQWGGISEKQRIALRSQRGIKFRSPQSNS